jgi:hypothetical protein
LIQDGEEANPVAVENLLFAAGRLQINSILPGTWEMDQARRVRFYRGEKSLLAYSVMEREGQFLVRPAGSDHLYSVTLPGYAGLDLDRVFSSDRNHYREHLLIDLLPSDIRHIEVERKGEEGFRFTMDDLGEILCTLPGRDSTLEAGLLDDLSIRLLFSYFTAIRYSEKATGDLDSLTAGDMEERWLGRLYVESKQGEKHRLEVYSMPGEQGEESHMFRAIVAYNNEPVPLIINYIFLDVLMRGLSSYFAGVV